VIRGDKLEPWRNPNKSEPSLVKVSRRRRAASRMHRLAPHIGRLAGAREEQPDLTRVGTQVQGLAVRRERPAVAGGVESGTRLRGMRVVTVDGRRTFLLPVLGVPPAVESRSGLPPARPPHDVADSCSSPSWVAARAPPGEVHIAASTPSTPITWTAYPSRPGFPEA